MDRKVVLCVVGAMLIALGGGLLYWRAASILLGGVIVAAGLILACGAMLERKP